MRKMSLLASVAVVIAAVGLSGGVAIAQVPQHHVTLTGAKETPPPVTPTAAASSPGRWTAPRLCYLLSAKKIGTAAAAHIHRGAVGVAGPVRVELSAAQPRVGRVQDHLVGARHRVARPPAAVLRQRAHRRLPQRRHPRPALALVTRDARRRPPG